MTLAEIKGGSAPTVSDKKNKIRLLKEYRQKYGYSINNTKIAKKILKNIKD